MKRFLLLAFVVMTCGAVQSAPARGGSTAIAVEGDYVYVVENGTVHKLSARDLKPVARTVLPARTAKKARKRRTISSASRRSPRRSARNVSRRKARRGTVRRAPAPRPMSEAPLPPI